jgi:hypothetical protein
MKKFGLITKVIIIALITIFASAYFLDDLRLANVFASSDENEEFNINAPSVTSYNFDRYSASMLAGRTSIIKNYSDTPMIYAFNHGYTGNPGIFTDGEPLTDTIVSKLQKETGADVYYAEM